MELRQLSYVVAVAEESHFGRPAAKVHIAQAALSNQVLALEKELGVQLFIRSTRRVELKRAGAAFYEHSVRILGEIDLPAEIVRSVAGKVTKQIAIGTVYLATIGMPPQFLSWIARNCPDIRMRIESGTTDDIISNIEAGRISPGFIRPVAALLLDRSRALSARRHQGQPAVMQERDRSQRSPWRQDDLVPMAEPLLQRTVFWAEVEEYDLTDNIA